LNALERLMAASLSPPIQKLVLVKACPFNDQTGGSCRQPAFDDGEC